MKPALARGLWARPFSPDATLVVHNPTAGRPAGRRRARRVAEVLHDAGFDVRQTRESRHAGRLAREAVSAGRRGLIVLGGDGTLFEAIEGLTPATALAVFPTGTVNLFARALALPRDPEPWLGLLRTGSTRAVYFGLCNGREFTSVASAGIDALVVRNVSARLKRAVHEAAFAVAAVRLLARRPPWALTAIVDERRSSKPLCEIIVGKGPYFAGPRALLPGASPHSPCFTVALAEGRRRRDMMRLAAGLMFGTLPRLRGVTIGSASRIRIEAEPSCPVELDGEPFGTTPAEISVDERPRVVLAP